MDLSDLAHFLRTALDDPIAQQLSDARFLPSLTADGQPTTSDDDGGGGVAVHRLVILARAPRLALQLQLHTKSGPFAIPNVDRAALDGLVRFLYCGDIRTDSMSPGTAMRLFRASKLWELAALSVYCQEFLSAGISDQQCVPFIILSYELDAPVLRSRCVDYVRRRFADVRSASANFDGLTAAQLVDVYRTQLPDGDGDRDLLCFCVEQGRADAVYHLLAHAADYDTQVNRDNSRGDSALLVALRHGRLHDIANTLIDYGADVNRGLLLHRVLRDGDAQAVRYLLDRQQLDLRACIDPVTGDGPLHVAVRSTASSDVLATLVRAGPSLELLNAAGLTPLAVCVEADNVDALTLLLDAGATALPSMLWRACALLHLAAAERLLQRGQLSVDYVIDCPPGSRNSLLLAAIHARNYRAALFLLDKGAALASVNAAGNSALHLLAACYADTDPQPDVDALRSLTTKICSMPAARQVIPLVNNDGYSPLRLALDCHANQLVEYLIDVGGADINETESATGNTLLHQRLLANDQEQVRFLLSKGAAADRSNLLGQTPLMLAVANSLSSAVSLLVSGGASTDHRDSDGRNLLRVSLQKRDFTIAKTLIDCGADLNHAEPDLSAGSGGGALYPLLHLAVLESDTDVLDFLVGQPSLDVNLQHGASGLTALHLAASQGYAEGIERLLQAHANPLLVDLGGHTALHIALLKQHVGAVELLIRHTPKKDIATLEPMFRDCVRLKNAPLAKILQHAGVDIEQVDRASGQSLLHRAIEEGDEAAVVFLMNPVLHVNVNTVDNNSRSPLHSAVRIGLRGIVNLLIASGANPSARDSCGRTFLWLAAQSGKDDIIKGTVAAWSELEAFYLPDSEGLTPLHAAIKASCTSTVLILLNHYDNFLSPAQLADTVHAVDAQKQQTALHYVPRFGASPNLARTLGERYPRLLHMQDYAGNTALHIACTTGEEATAIELVKLGASLCTPNHSGISPLRTKPLSKTEGEWQIFQRVLLEEIRKEPEWLPDEAIETCQLCSREFGFVRRRHHCRYCGQVICGDCSPKSWHITRFKIDTPVRLCRFCYHVLSNPRSN